MSMMVTAVLDVNKMEAAAMGLCPARCDVVAIARDVIQQMKGLARGVVVQFESSGDCVPAVADAVMVGRVLQNLLGNALRYSPGGEIVRVRVTATDDGGVRVSVTDCGPGVPPAAREQIFAKFLTLDSPGHTTGLGLAFCRMAIEAHGGAIGLDSGPGGRGSAFWFTLPQAMADAERQAA